MSLYIEGMTLYEFAGRLNAEGIVIDFPHSCYTFFGHPIIEIPTRDVKPLGHGRWIPYTEEVDGCKFIGHRCSICNKWEGFTGDFNFCPNCGADMRGEKE